jgi:type II secretory pathway pseudopilin PulG
MASTVMGSVRLSPRPADAGFSLVEVLLAGALGVCLCGVMLQSLLSDGQNSQRLSRLQRERANQRRTLELVRSDVERAVAVSAYPENEASACGWAGRKPVLYLQLDGNGSISYSVGGAPSGIWRGQVLMRCGPAFDVFGRLSTGGTPQNRVVIDGLAKPESAWTGCQALVPGAEELNGTGRDGFAACLDSARQVLAMRLYQVFGPAPTPGSAAAHGQRISAEATASPG